jgi:hypothetical protein
VSINSDDVGKYVGGGVVLEIVIGIALPIPDGLCCHPQKSATPTIIEDIGSYAPPLVGVCAVFNHCIAFIVVVVVANVKVLLMPPPPPPQS